MRNRSLRFKLTSAGILLVLVPLLVVGIFSTLRSSNALREIAEAQVSQIASDLAEMMDLLIKEEIKLVEQLRLDPELVGFLATLETEGADAKAGDGLEAMLKAKAAQLGEGYETILVVNRRGVVVADGSGGENRGMNLSGRDYVRQALDGKTNMGAPVFSKITGNPVAPFCSPVRGEHDLVLGGLVTVFKMDVINDIFSQVKVGVTGYPFMVDGDGLCVVHPNPDHLLKTNLARLRGMEAIMDRMLAGQRGVGRYVFEGIDKIAGYAPVTEKGWSVGVTQPAEEFLSASNQIRNVITLSGLGFFALAALGVFAFAGRLSRQVMKAASELEAGASQVAAASEQVSSSSQMLAEASSQSAASIEETSSSLEEMASLTKQNAENAANTRNLMQETWTMVESSDEAMGRLSKAMAQISSASNETQKIVKTIDEIAFQTNLIAPGTLNEAMVSSRCVLHHICRSGCPFHPCAVAV